MKYLPVLEGDIKDDYELFTYNKQLENLNSKKSTGIMK